MTDALLTRDASLLAADIRSGTLTARTLTDACLARIAAREPLIGAWAFVDPALARAQADACDAQRGDGPLAGVPIGIKDVIATRDMPTAYNSPLYAGHRTAGDAACVALLRAAGAVILGKTTTVEMASIGRPPATRNPHAPEHTPGGSSSGSAAAVADGHVPLALGTQTGGSIIRPASFCGVWALKPTWGTVSTEGAKPFAPSLDTIGWFGRSPADLALLLDALDAAPPPATPVPMLGNARIAVWRTAGWPRAEAATRGAIDAAIALLRHAGAIMEEFAFPYPDLADIHHAIMFAEGQRAFLADDRAGGEGLHPRIADMVRTGGGFSRDALRAAYDRAAEARAAFDVAAAGYDAVLAPSTLGTAPHGLAATGDLLFNGLLTLLHVPCVNLPLFRGADGLPVGVTLAGPRFADRQTIAVAQAIAAAVPANA